MIRPKEYAAVPIGTQRENPRLFLTRIQFIVPQQGTWENGKSGCTYGPVPVDFSKSNI